MRQTKTMFLFVICIICHIAAYTKTESNRITITGLNTGNVMSADIRQWGMSSSLSLTAQTNSSEGGIYSRLVVQIRQATATICGNTPAATPTVNPFTSRTFSATELSGLLSSCSRLPAGAYTICAQFYDDKNEPISKEVCTEFRVEGSAGTTTIYSPPQNILPVDNRHYINEEMTQPVTFSWSAVTPQPEVPVTYRLRVWPLIKGQSNLQAMQTNQPLLVKDVTAGTSAIVSGSLLGPCNSSEPCKYIWNVQALNSQGVPFGTNNGYSQPSSIVVSTYIIQIDSLKVTCTSTPGVYSFSYYIKNPNVGTAKLTNFAITSSTPAGAILTSFSPPLNTTFVSGATLAVTGTITASPSLTNICIGAEITDVVNSFWKASRDTCIRVTPCVCDACDPKKVNININPTTNIVINANNTLTYTQPVSIITTPLKLVNSIRAELVYFEFVPENEDCLPCNRDSKTFGNMDNGTLATIIAAGAGSHSLQWIFSPPKNFTTASNAVVTITLPPTVKCCAATIRWCVRYVVTFNDCTVCNKLVCYEKKKDGCANGNPNNQN